MGITKAYYCWLSRCVENAASSFGTTKGYPYTTDYTESSYSCKNTSGTIISAPFWFNPNRRSPFHYLGESDNNGSTYIRVGTNSSPESILDYKITTPSGVSCRLATTGTLVFTPDINNNKYCATIKCLISNGNSESVSICEIGAYYYAWHYYTSSVTSYITGNNTFLVYRKVIDPVTIPANSDCVLSLDVELPLYLGPTT